MNVDELVKFLRARLNEDAHVAMVGGEDVETWGADGHGGITTGGTYPYTVAQCEPENHEVQAHITRWDPARVLREIEAKRALIEHAGQDDRALRLLALPYSGHEDYRQEWDPTS